MFWIILYIVLGASALIAMFLWAVLREFAKAAEEAHRDGWDNPFK